MKNVYTVQYFPQCRRKCCVPLKSMSYDGYHRLSWKTDKIVEKTIVGLHERNKPVKNDGIDIYVLS